MRDYGRVYVAFWSSEEIRSMSDDGRLLALYLLTSSHTTISGVFRLPDGYVSDDLQWSSERVSNGFSELFRIGFASRCDGTKWVWVRKFLEWNAPEGPNQWKAARKIAALVPEGCSWITEFKAFFARAAGDMPSGEEKPIRMGSESPSNAGTGTGTGTGTGLRTSAQPTARSPRRNVSRETDPDWWLDFKLAYPERAGDHGWRTAQKAANARMAEGHTPAEFIAGAKRYTEFCAATGAIGTQYVKLPATFLGPGKPFLEAWHAPSDGAPKGLHRDNVRPDALEVARRAT